MSSLSPFTTATMIAGDMRGYTTFPQFEHVSARSVREWASGLAQWPQYLLAAYQAAKCNPVTATNASTVDAVRVSAPASSNS